jgi:phospholipase/lecithinase/hemolysin
MSPTRSRPPRTIRLRRPDARLARALAGLGVVASLALLAAAPSSASPSSSRVTVIGDSITASFEYVPAAKRHLGKGLELRSDAVVCRRLVVTGCAFHGSVPTSALELIGANRRSLGSVVVVNVGYNDWAAVYDVDRVMRSLATAGVTTAIWVTLRETTANYARINSRIRAAARRWRQDMVVADWNTRSRGKPWFREDGLHLTVSGAMGLARLLRPIVVAGSSR